MWEAALSGISTGRVSKGSREVKSSGEITGECLNP